MKTKILIVDDRPENISALSLLIESETVEILTATSGEEALGLVLDHEFGLALLDVQMPVMTGFELAKLIRGIDRGKRLPIIFVTAATADADLIYNGYESGAVDVLFKPVDPHAVRNKVQVFVQLDQADRLLREQMQELTRLKELAEAANTVKGNLLRNISHELRTPLSAVLGFADLLKAGPPLPEEGAKYLESVRRNAQQLLQVVNDVLDMSLLISSGQQRLAESDSVDQALARASASTVSATKQADANRMSPDPAEALKGKHILVVDDVPDNRVLVERYLAPSGVHVLMAGGGREAIQKVSTEECDLILMDIQMPGMDGCEATERLRALGFTKPIVALTAHALSGELDRCLRAGCDLALTKPITKRSLVDRLSEILTAPV